jgi:Skp family chaperone for outer membrane proteins
MDRKDYIEMLETKEDEWVGVLQGRIAELQQEDIAKDVAYCEQEREKIQHLEKKLEELRARREELKESGDTSWKDLQNELDKIVEEFECDMETVVYYEGNTEPKE